MSLTLPAQVTTYQILTSDFNKEKKSGVDRVNRFPPIGMIKWHRSAAPLICCCMFESLPLHACKYAWPSLHFACPHRSAFILAVASLLHSQVLQQVCRQHCSSNACSLAHTLREVHSCIPQLLPRDNPWRACRLILDESHSVKSMNTVQGKACMAIEADRRWVDFVHSLQCCCALGHGLLCRPPVTAMPCSAQTEACVWELRLPIVAALCLLQCGAEL